MPTESIRRAHKVRRMRSVKRSPRKPRKPRNFLGKYLTRTR